MPSFVGYGQYSPTFDEEGPFDLATEIYQLERHKLELGQLIGQVSALWRITRMNFLFFSVTF